MQISKKAILCLLVAVSLAACGKDDGDALNEAGVAAAQEAARDGRAECALAGSAIFKRICTAERTAAANGDILFIRHADGGFRRFRILTDGRGLAPADGFDETKISLMENGMIEVSSGDDRYRLPAQLKSDAVEATEDAG